MSIKKMKKIIDEGKQQNIFENIFDSIRSTISSLDSILEDKSMCEDIVVHKAQKLKADLLNAISVCEDMSMGDGTMADLGTPPTYALGSVDARGGSRVLNKENPFLKKSKKKKQKSEMMSGGEPEISRVMRERQMTYDEAKEYLRIKFSKEHNVSSDTEDYDKKTNESFDTSSDNYKSLRTRTSQDIKVGDTVSHPEEGDIKVTSVFSSKIPSGRSIEGKTADGRTVKASYRDIIKKDECFQNMDKIYGYDLPSIQREIKELKVKISSTADEREKSELVSKLQDLLIRTKQKKESVEPNYAIGRKLPFDEKNRDKVIKIIKSFEGYAFSILHYSKDNKVIGRIHPNQIENKLNDILDDVSHLLVQRNTGTLFVVKDAGDYLVLPAKVDGVANFLFESFSEDFHDNLDGIDDYDERDTFGEEQDYQEEQPQIIHQEHQERYPQVIKISELKNYSDEQGEEKFQYIQNEQDVETYLEHAGVDDETVMNETPYVGTSDIDFLMIDLKDGEVGCIYVGHGVPALNKEVFKVYERF